MLFREIEARTISADAPGCGSETRNQVMAYILHPFVVRVRILRAYLWASLRKLLRMNPNDGDFTSLRMCPSCGLVTSRYESRCLECHKVLNPA